MIEKILQQMFGKTPRMATVTVPAKEGRKADGSWWSAVSRSSIVEDARREVQTGSFVLYGGKR